MLLFLESGGNVEWLGDGFCDDKNNNVFCHFDKADCCGNGVNKQFCIDCDCISKPKIFYSLGMFIKDVPFFVNFVRYLPILVLFCPIFSHIPKIGHPTLVNIPTSEYLLFA